jgi:hypothetical protein
MLIFRLTMIMVILFMPYGLEGIFANWRRPKKGRPEEATYDAEKT